MSAANADHSNNFDALRLFAASSVIFSHSWPLSGHYDEPIYRLTNGTIGGGTLGVWMFFFISGHLVAESFVRRGLFAFLEARFLRIMPGLATCLIFGILIGASVTTLPLNEFFSSDSVRDYFFHGLKLKFEYELPGVFLANPMAKSVNGSLWTLPPEVSMYMSLAVLGTLRLLRYRLAGSIFLGLLLVYLSVDASLVARLPLVGHEVMAPPIRSFMLGVLFYLNRDRIKLHGALAICLIALVVPGQAKPEGPLLVCLAIAYTTMWAAYHPSLKVPVSKRVGDISYGMYIYAFPIQQLVAYHLPGISSLQMFAISLAATAIVAWLSWRWIERPALRFKGRVSGWVSAKFRRGIRT
jgi:peptidoglycan/LPS O-acetylase OafA/YrhL